MSTDFKYKKGDVVFVSKECCEGYPQGTICIVGEIEYMTSDKGVLECAYEVFPVDKEVEFSGVGFWHCNDCLRAIAWSVDGESQGVTL